MPNGSRFGLGCCCGSGVATPTPGYLPCCPVSPIPPSLSITFAFGAPTNAATYYSQTVNTTLTYYPTPPAWVFNPFGSVGPMHFSNTFVDDLGQTLYYTLHCTTPGQVVLGIGIAAGTTGAAAPGNCMPVTLNACSPFLASFLTAVAPVPPNPTFSCFNNAGMPGIGYVFGNQAGDGVTIS